jgi:hypothetical protein
LEELQSNIKKIDNECTILFNNKEEYKKEIDNINKIISNEHEHDNAVIKSNRLVNEVCKLLNIIKIPKNIIYSSINGGKYREYDDVRCSRKYEYIVSFEYVINNDNNEMKKIRIKMKDNEVIPKIDLTNKDHYFAYLVCILLLKDDARNYEKIINNDNIYIFPIGDPAYYGSLITELSRKYDRLY